MFKIQAEAVGVCEVVGWGVGRQKCHTCRKEGNVLWGWGQAWGRCRQKEGEGRKYGLHRRQRHALCIQQEGKRKSQNAQWNEME